MPRRSLRKYAAKTTLPYERNRKDFHKMLEMVAKPGVRTVCCAVPQLHAIIDLRQDLATKKRLGLLKASLLSREEKLKAGQGTVSTSESCESNVPISIGEHEER